MESSQVQSEDRPQVQSTESPQVQSKARAQGSEVAQLLQQIREEWESAYRGLSGFAHVGQHKYITTRMENVSRLHDQLKTMIGEEATDLVISQMDQASQSVSQNASI